MAEDPPATPEASTGRSATVVAGGLALLGISASVFLVLAARATGPETFAGLAVLWTLVYTVGIGLFLPFEQELARAIAGRRAEGSGSGPLVARAWPLAVGLFVAACVVAAAILPWLHDWLGRSTLTTVALFGACAALAVQYFARGVFSGSGRFVPYAVQIGVEGTVRLVGCVALVVAGVSAAAPYALLLVAAPAVSLLVTAPAFSRLSGRAGPPADLGEISVNLGWLLGASLAAQGLANLGTLAVTVLVDASQQAAAGHFLAGLTISRAPLFLFAAIQAVLLPALTRMLAHGRHQGFRRQLRVTLLATSALGAAGVLGTWLLGPQLLGLLFGESFDLPRSDMTLLAVSTAVYMVALVLQPAVIALANHRGNAIGWLVGLTAFGLALAVPVEVFLRVELALIAGAAAVSLTLGVILARGLEDMDTRTPEPDPATFRLGME